MSVKEFCVSSNLSKDEPNFWSIFALASKKWVKSKRYRHFNYQIPLISISTYDNEHFLAFKNLVRFLGDLQTPKFLEINWPLHSYIYLIAKKAQTTADRIHVDFNDMALFGFGDGNWYFPHLAAYNFFEDLFIIYYLPFWVIGI